MTGAGSATVAWTPEEALGDGPGVDPTWRGFIDVAVNDLSIDQALERSRYPDDPTPARSRARDFEGALGVSFALAGEDWHELVFADGGTALPNSPMAVPSSTWYLGVDLPDSTTDARTPTGVIVTGADVQFQRPDDVRVDLTMLYGFEPEDVDAPEAVEQPDKDAVYSYHGTHLDVDGTSQSLMDTATLSLNNLARFRRGQSRHPFDAVTGAIEPSLSTDATYTESDQRDVAYGSTSAGGIEMIDQVNAELSFENGLGEEIGYDMSGVQPTNYTWSDLVGDTDLGEPVDYHVADVEVV